MCPALGGGGTPTRGAFCIFELVVSLTAPSELYCLLYSSIYLCSVELFIFPILLHILQSLCKTLHIARASVDMT